MKTLVRTLAALAIVAGVLLVGVDTASAHGLADSRGATATCPGGVVAPGTYSSLTITGMCAVPSGLVTVQGNLVIAQNAALDAHFDAATLIVQGNARVEKNAVFILGCLESGCDTTNNRVDGNIVATGALALIFHHNTIGGNISVHQGGGGASCAPNPLFGGPVFSDFEDNTVGGNLVVTQLHSCWMGVIRDHVQGNVIVIHNVMADSDANEITTNVIGGNLACFHNSPAAQFGDAAPVPNVVSGNKLGECAAL